MEWELGRLDRGTYGDEQDQDLDLAAGDSNAAGPVRPSGDVLGTFFRALELMAEFKPLPVPLPAIETTAKQDGDGQTDDRG